MSDPATEVSPQPEAALARLYGEPLFEIPSDLYIPPDALRVFLESFEGPLDLLLWLIRRQKFNVMDIPMALLTEQYMRYVELIRQNNLELAADYLVMAAELMRIKSRLLLPRLPPEEGQEPEDPQAELARRLLEYERMKLAAVKLDAMPRSDRDFYRAVLLVEQEQEVFLPGVDPHDLQQAWQDILSRATLTVNHHVAREELSVREHMSKMMKLLSERSCLEFTQVFALEGEVSMAAVIVNYLALLELAKENLIVVTQAAPFAPIYVTLPPLALAA